MLRPTFPELKILLAKFDPERHLSRVQSSNEITNGEEIATNSEEITTNSEEITTNSEEITTNSEEIPINAQVSNPSYNIILLP